MKKEPTVNRNENILPEIRRRKRKIIGEHALSNVSYQSLLDLYVRECKLKNLSETTISGYVYATRYFLDFEGNEWCVSHRCPCLTCEYWLNENLKPKCACKPCNQQGLKRPEAVICYKTSKGRYGYYDIFKD